MVTNKFYFMHEFDLPCNFYQSMCAISISIQNHLQYDELRQRKALHTNFVKLEIWQKQPSDMKAMTPRGILGLCCVHISQLMIHPAISKLPFTLQLYQKLLAILQRITKAQRFIMIMSWLISKLYNLNLSENRSKGFPEWEDSSRHPSFPH